MKRSLKYMLLSALVVLGGSNLLPVQSVQATESHKAIVFSNTKSHEAWSSSESNALWVNVDGYVGYIYKTYKMNAGGQYLFKGTLIKQRSNRPYYAPFKVEKNDYKLN